MIAASTAAALQLEADRADTADRLLRWAIQDIKHGERTDAEEALATAAQLVRETRDSLTAIVRDAAGSIDQAEPPSARHGA